MITDAENRRPSKRVRAAELVNAETRFDAEKYLDLLILAGANILSPFGYTEKLLKDVVYGEKQSKLTPFPRTTYHEPIDRNI